MVDRYTRSVLTVIAAALTVLAVQGFIRPASAQYSGIQRVQICDSLGQCASLSRIPLKLGSQTVWSENGLAVVVGGNLAP
jgi:hypothetical protein